MDTAQLLIRLFVPLSAAIGLLQQEGWKAPEAEASRTNPIPVSEASVLAGRAVYQTTCAACHGDAGHGDGFAARMLKRPAKDLSQVLGAQSDGEIFWKVRTGNDVMPSSAGALSEEATWQVVNYVRALVKPKLRTHPWASFAQGAWVDVHTHHEMSAGAGAAPATWDSDSRMSVADIGEEAVLVQHDHKALDLSERATLVVPAVDEFPGVRAEGQWPHDIFPFGPERKSGVTPEDKQPPPTNVRSKTLRMEQVQVAGKSFQTQVIEKRWEAHRKGRVEEHTLTAWIAEGVELPLRSTLTVDGAALSESAVVSFEEEVDVAGVALPCMVTLTTKHLPEGDIVKRRWSNAQVPGFLVKMESRLESKDFSLIVNEWITGFQAEVAPQKAIEGAAPAAKPGLGIRPEDASSKGGVLVVSVTPDGPAAKAGILAADIIVELDGNPVTGLDDYAKVLSALSIGKEITVKLMRDGKAQELKAVVGQRTR